MEALEFNFDPGNGHMIAEANEWGPLQSHVRLECFDTGFEATLGCLALSGDAEDTLQAMALAGGALMQLLTFAKAIPAILARRPSASAPPADCDGGQ